jgi:hypothetical protein
MSTRARTGLIVVAAVVVVAGLVYVKHLTAPSPTKATGWTSTYNAEQGGTWFGWRDIDLLPLSGTLVTTPVTDWSFVLKQRNVSFRLHPWYHIAYNVTTSIATSRDHRRLYLFSYYYPPPTPNHTDYRDKFPAARAWNRHVMRDPRIRLKVGDQLFDGLVYPVTDIEEIEDVRGGLIARSTSLARFGAELPPEQRGRLFIFRVVPQWGVEEVKRAHTVARSGLELMTPPGAQPEGR